MDYGDYVASLDFKDYILDQVEGLSDTKEKNDLFHRIFDEHKLYIKVSRINLLAIRKDIDAQWEVSSDPYANFNWEHKGIYKQVVNSSADYIMERLNGAPLLSGNKKQDDETLNREEKNWVTYNEALELFELTKVIVCINPEQLPAFFYTMQDYLRIIAKGFHYSATSEIKSQVEMDIGRIKNMLDFLQPIVSGIRWTGPAVSGLDAFNRILNNSRMLGYQTTEDGSLILRR